MKYGTIPSYALAIALLEAERRKYRYKRAPLLDRMCERVIEWIRWSAIL